MPSVHVNYLCIIYTSTIALISCQLISENPQQFKFLTVNKHLPYRLGRLNNQSDYKRVSIA